MAWSLREQRETERSSWPFYPFKTIKMAGFYFESRVFRLKNLYFKGLMSTVWSSGRSLGFSDNILIINFLEITPRARMCPWAGDSEGRGWVRSGEDRSEGGPTCSDYAPHDGIFGKGACG